MNFKKLYLSFLSISMVHAHDLNHGGLCDTLKLYKKEYGFGHAGHLWEHTVWVVKAVERYIATQSQWMQGISEEDEYVLVVAAFLHDIGKAGDFDYTFHLKECHPEVGYEYFVNKRPFYVNEDKEELNFSAWCEANQVSSEMKEVLAILIGMHQEFGNVLKRVAQHPTEKGIAFAVFLERLIGYCRKVYYRNGYPDERIVRMCITLGVADIEGMFPVSYPSKYFPELADEPQTLFNASRFYDYPLLDTKGYALAQELIEYCKKRTVLLSAPYSIGAK